MNYKVETVSLKSLAKLQAERNRRKYSDDPAKPIKNILLQFGDGDGSWMDRWMTNTIPSVSSFKDGYKKPMSGFKADKQKQLEQRIKQGQDIRSNITTTKAERQLYGRQFESDSSCSGSEWDSMSSEEDEDEKDETEETGKKEEREISLPPLHITHTKAHPSSSLAERPSPRTRKYIGPHARRRFFRRFQKTWQFEQKYQTQTRGKPTLSGDLLLGSTEKELGTKKQLVPLDLSNLGSARGKFLKRVASENLPPQPAMIRKFKSKELNLTGMSLGDDLGRALAEALPCIPHLEELDLSNNRLTGISLSQMLNAITMSDTLHTLNLSDNYLGKLGMQSLISFLATTHVLKDLLLSGTKSGDEEAKILCQGLSLNTTVEYLNVANNMFAESAGHSFAKMLRRMPSLEDSTQIVSSVCCVTNLDLSWNQIRKTGAIAMGTALLFNDALQTLDLSYCAFGDVGEYFPGIWCAVVLGVGMTFVHRCHFFLYIPF